MARLSKARKRKTQEVAPVPKKNTKMKDFWLISFIFVNIFVLAIGYKTLDLPSIGMYSLLVLTLISIYVKKHFTFSEKTEKYIEQFGLGAIGVAFVLFIYVLYQKFTA